jgi:hypothetical protein
VQKPKIRRELQTRANAKHPETAIRWPAVTEQLKVSFIYARLSHNHTLQVTDPKTKPIQSMLSKPAGLAHAPSGFTEAGLKGLFHEAFNTLASALAVAPLAASAGPGTNRRCCHQYLPLACNHRHRRDRHRRWLVLVLRRCR